MLTAYLTRTTQLLQNPPATTALYSTTDLTSYINSARGQLAGETECIRVFGTLTLGYTVNNYPFSAIDVSGVAGVAGVFNVRGATIGIAMGGRWLTPRPFPWFQLYCLNNPVPQPGTPRVYSQFGQGENGTIYFDPVPDDAYPISVDCVCLPDGLATDADPEAIPYPYTDAVPYYAAYLAFMSAQRAADAQRLWQEYQKFSGRGRALSNGTVNPEQYPRQPNPVRAGQLGIRMDQGGGGQS